MNEAQIQKMLPSIIPFVGYVGLTIDSVGTGTATASLGNREEIQNHLGSVHAGALYTVGESATGAVVLQLFADVFPNVFIALKGATVAHSKARQGDLVATATLAEDAAAVRGRYDETGKSDFVVDVEFTVDGTAVAAVSYTWAARRPRG